MITKRRRVIDSFREEHAFLSNFYEHPVTFLGIQYQTNEHAYQAAKTLDKKERTRIWIASTPGLAKKRGQQVTLRPDWEEVKIDIMADLVAQKFSGKVLSKWLLATGDAELVEANSWGDAFWGVCGGKGENHLGKLLMAVREELRAYDDE